MSRFGIHDNQVRYYAENAQKVTLVNNNIHIPMVREKDHWVASITPGDYAFEVNGKLYPDPYGKDLSTPTQWKAKRGPLMSCFSLEPPFDWQGYKKHTLSTKLIYEMHVRGFTQDPSSKVQHPGTFLGVIEKIDHLQKIGITAIELMPIFEFDERHNFWGYSPISFFTPMRRYGTKSDFQLMVRELHRANIGVILDVVYNHLGKLPLFNKNVYYLHDQKGKHTNYSGCGNTVNCNHPLVQEWILSSLNYWIEEMGVDGFRFDLASILTRLPDHSSSMQAPLIKAITKLNTTLIAEPWDAAGLYQLGQFPKKWLEWNGAVRDQLRQNMAIDNPLPPEKSLNFITAHDGFTLNDLVSYEKKHNEANGENNRDGTDYNLSQNFGVEGPTKNPKIREQRENQMLAFINSLVKLPGSTMILMGDEYKHSRLGNNNAWCQDNRLNYFCWDTLKLEQDYFKRFCKVLQTISRGRLE